MKNKTKEFIIRIAIYIVLLIVTICLSLLIAKAIWGSNLPEWLKVFLIAS